MFGHGSITDIIGHFEDDFYRQDDQTSSVKALKEYESELLCAGLCDTMF